MKDRCWPVEGHPRPLILIDIAQPRDVENGAATIDGVRLFSIDNLRIYQRADHEHPESRSRAGP